MKRKPETRIVKTPWNSHYRYGCEYQQITFFGLIKRWVEFDYEFSLRSAKDRIDQFLFDKEIIEYPDKEDSQ